MRRFSILLATAVMMLLTSCGASKFYSQSAESVRPLALVQPFTYLTDAFGDFATTYSDPVSKANNALLLDIISASGLPVDRVVPFEYRYADKSDETVRWMRRLADIGGASAETLVVPADIVEAVRRSGCRYGMVLSDIGFVKNPEQYAVERAIEVGSKVLDFVFNNSVDISKDTESYLNGMFSLIFDSETGEVIWFGSRPRDYKHNPLSRADMTDQLTKLYKAFL